MKKKDSVFNGSKNIILLGLVSMFIDMSTEMAYPLIPLFLVSLGTAPVVIGIIEGVTEGLATLLKAFAGYVSDKTKRKKPLALLGYSAAFFYKIGIILSTSWVGVFISKIVDRTGKGLRTAPRDSLIAESGKTSLGGKYGLHKTFDMLGAALGVLLAYLILSFAPSSTYTTVFYWSLLPAAIGVIVLSFVNENDKISGSRHLFRRRKENGLFLENDVYGVKNAEQSAVDEIWRRRESGESADKVKEEKLRLRDVKPGKKVWLYLAFLFVFSIGNSSNAFLLLRAQANGVGTTDMLLFYLLFNTVASVFSIPCGKLSDKVGKKFMIVVAYLIYAATYLCFGLVESTAGIAVLFGVYGFYQAFVSGAEKSLAVEMSPKNIKGTVLGLQGAAQGLGVFASSLIAGVLWNYVDPSYAFFFGAATALVSAVAMSIILSLPNKNCTAENLSQNA